MATRPVRKSKNQKSSVLRVIGSWHGIAIIWERDLGIVHKFLVSPASRAALVLGKALSAGVLTLSQALIIYLLAVLLGVHKDLSLLALIGVSLVVLIGAAFFSAFSLIIVCLVKTRERFMGISLDLLILVLATTLLVAIGAMLYPRVAI